MIKVFAFLWLLLIAAVAFYVTHHEKAHAAFMTRGTRSVTGLLGGVGAGGGGLGPAPPVGDFMLLENGDVLLLESGDKILL